MNPNTAPRAGRREWIGLAVIALPCLLYSMDLTVLELAVPKLSADLRPTSSQLLWILDIYGFLVAGFLMTMGALGDRIGRRKLLLIGAAAFGAASGISETSAEFGGALGIAILGSIGTAVYRNQVSDAAEAARDTLGGTVAAGKELPDATSDGLLDTAREAFVQGLQVVSLTSAAIVVGMAVLVVALLRDVRTGSEPEDQPDRRVDRAVPGSAPERS
jgi:MFS family permease